MAIGKYSAVPPPPELSAAQSSAAPPPPQQQQQQQPNAPQHAHTASGTLDIEAWTISALQSLSVSPDSRGTNGGMPLTIPLDEQPSRATTTTTRVTIALNEAHVAGAADMTPPHRPPSRRDSMKRREALLKGKEGSRQRRRWDMARLSDVPNVEPPAPSDWEPRPVYPIHHIPYHVAQYWDRGLRQQVEEKQKMAAGGSRRHQRNPAAPEGKGRVPRDLRETVKKTPGVVGWVRSLEEPVRQFLLDRGGGAVVPEDVVVSESDVSDDEVVFVGRKSALPSADGRKKARCEGHDREVENRGMIFDSLEDDESGAFKRWLTHSISGYYGLDSRSVTMGTPARRCVYIGIREIDVKKGRDIWTDLPRPLWEHF